ncbi:MAG: phosphoenolpyruvate--protein phosphotransferase [Gammaproteobacteria bacterium]|nr:phosphoenolpyruvate--protein phosphotransferase [Gammaproteobacteria bacterium]
MLKILRRIVQEVNSAQNLREALDIATKRIKDAISSEACSIFLVDEERGEYVLMATEGLNKDCINKARLKFGEGLIGLVGEREEPINLDDAPTHPRFRYYPDIGEEHYHAFLGVPIIHHRQLLGVLFIQQREPRRFDESEEAFLVTLSVQLASAIAHAQAVGILWELNDRDIESKTFSGLPGAPGVAIGTAVIVYPLADLDAVPDRKIADIDEEIKLFREAVAITTEDIRSLAQSLTVNLPKEEQGIFDAYLRILDSPSFIDKVIAEIQQGTWAQAALKRAIKQYVVQFDAMDDAYLKERGADFRDLGQRILCHLQSGDPQAQFNYPKQTILVGEEVTPSALAGIPEDQLVGLVSSKGSNNSHVAILARAMGIPTVMGVSNLPVAKLETKELIIDGYYGQVYCSPSSSIREEFTRLSREEKELDNELEALRDLHAETLDGYSLSMFINTGLISDVSRALGVGAEGVGLYRTEVPFMVRDRFPSEDEQRIIYRQLLQAFAPRPVLMRTLDIGGDKELPYFPVQESNPFLGWRGIRVTLDHPEIFLVQIRAMLRASQGLENLHIMLPMVSSIAEVEEAQRLIAQAYSELIEEGEQIRMPSMGVMVEVPSAVYQARELAKRVDFLSVGSNDLIQYLLAVDRNNVRVANLYDALHPAVLKALIQVVEGGHQEGKQVSICGEMAGDPVTVILLLAMGFDTLSMSAARLPRMKWVIRKFTMARAIKLLDEVLAMDDPIEIRCHLELAIEEAGLGGLIRAGK